MITRDGIAYSDPSTTSPRQTYIIIIFSFRCFCFDDAEERFVINVYGLGYEQKDIVHHQQQAREKDSDHDKLSTFTIKYGGIHNHSVLILPNEPYIQRHWDDFNRKALSLL